MKPRLVKALQDSNGKTVKTFDTEVVRQTVSKETADEMKDIMQYVVDNGGGGAFKVDGYKVGGKTVQPTNRMPADIPIPRILPLLPWRRWMILRSAYC